MNYPISVFLDTNIFDGCKYHFDDDSVLRILESFQKNGKVRIYISNIVLKEAEKHIEDAIDNIYKVLKSKEKEIRRMISPSILEDVFIEKHFELPVVNEMKEISLNKFHAFLKNTDTIILDNNGIDINRIICDYFDNNPPFESKEKKKNEFPDAFIISRLKEEFSINNQVWIVSGDKGFQAAFNELEGFNSINSLKELFDMLNKQEILYNKIKDYFKNSEEIKKIGRLIEAEIENNGIEIDGMDCDRKGICDGFDYDEVYIESISNVEVSLNSVDEINDENIIVTVMCNADFVALCLYDDYDNAIWDSEEKEYFFLRRSEIREFHHADFECVLKFSISGECDEFILELEKISYDLELDQHTRTDREFFEDSDPEFDALADMMDALEEYHKH
ncbi:PIN domain-containing protein [Clostridium algidicarnis]|uniref:PIN domain-containing protein n=1 Tax=Clostridium algidicarnis TaxID=37659 RepID=UPI001C0ADBAC|nr:PIN domain-containing protein [Clostridium algidicarnis]MBU3202745.1 DUF4935 domain-containing protein [Clostridium algidicarnis]MBU3210899.1 DUF4935 domain-containing protein [Clostridium algidicarnis]MBU3222593.1 DUF4935 domain-containing protein [Clostridium algidicarnis]